MAQLIKACANDSEVLCSVPRTHLKEITITSCPFNFWMCILVHTHTHKV